MRQRPPPETGQLERVQGPACDLCDTKGTAWTCPKESCDYDACLPCHDKAATTRHLKADIKAHINFLLPNLGGAADPNYGKIVQGPWAKKHVVKDNSKTLQQIAIEQSRAILVQDLTDLTSYLAGLEADLCNVSPLPPPPALSAAAPSSAPAGGSSSTSILRRV